MDSLLMKSPLLRLSPSPFLSTHVTLMPKPKPLPISNISARRFRHCTIRASTFSDIDMVKNKQGVYAPRSKKVVVLWDLDNKPPTVPPYDAATALKQLAEKFGEVVEVSAYANRHAFSHVPRWVVQERRERKQLDIDERRGIVTPPAPYVCTVCGRKCKTNMDLKKHFKQLHEREREKKLNRLRSLKGKKRQKFKEKYISGNEKYNEAARALVKPKVGYGLAAELRRAGVYVKTVEDKPQAADWAVKRQMQHSLTRGIDWLFLVSDDSDFADMLRKAREANLGTVVVGDMDRALGRHADLWVPWSGVENGELAEEDLVPKKRNLEGEEFDRDDGMFSLSVFDEEDDDDDDDDGESELDSVVDDLVGGWSGVRVSAFSEEDEEEEEDWVGYELD